MHTASRFPAALRYSLLATVPAEGGEQDLCLHLLLATQSDSAQQTFHIRHCSREQSFRSVCCLLSWDIPRGHCSVLSPPLYCGHCLGIRRHCRRISALGGIFVCAAALQHQERCKHLILGIPVSGITPFASCLQLRCHTNTAVVIKAN